MHGAQCKVGLQITSIKEEETSCVTCFTLTNFSGASLCMDMFYTGAESFVLLSMLSVMTEMTTRTIQPVLQLNIYHV